MNEVWEQGHELLEAGGPWGWIVALVLALVLTTIVKISLRTLTARLRRIALFTSGRWDDIVIECLGRTKMIVVFTWFLYPLLRMAQPGESTVRFARATVVVLTVFQFSLWGICAIRRWKDGFIKLRLEQDAASAAALGLLFTTLQFGLVILLVLIGLSNLGVDIGALIAGLGVGGIAVALAAQNVLGDLLASLSIVLDKPFVVGDFIVVGNEMGTVETIGLKTTRVRSLSGEELIFSNKDLLESRVRNFKRMWKRRVVQQFGVTYSTPPEKLEQIPGWVKEFVGKYPKLNFDRCHFAKYGGSSLDFELVFWVEDPDYNLYMDFQQGLLLDILRKFEAEAIEFAFPTQTLYIEKLPQAEQSFPANEPALI
ncbi:MAG: mechanosensitive ion channel family protein [Bdellovibrionales bacterium]